MRTILTAVLFATLTIGAPGQKRQTLTLRQLSAPQTLFEFLPDWQWIPGTARVASIEVRRRDRVTSFAAGDPSEPTVLFTAVELHAALQKAGETGGDPRRLPGNLSFRDADTVRVQLASGVFHFKIETKTATRVLTIPRGATPLAVSANDQRLAFVKDHQLHVAAGNGPAKALTTDGSPDIVYGAAAHRSEFGIHDGLWWGPRGRYLAFFREDLRGIAAYPYADHTALPPKAIHGRYPMAGGPNSHVQVGIHDTTTGKTYYLSHGEVQDKYWTNATFEPSGLYLYLALVNRAQDRMEMVRFGSSFGRSEGVLFTESDPQWVEPQHGPIFLNDQTSRFLWFSPRDGYQHLYLYDAEGQLQKQLTKGAFDIAEFRSFDEGAKHAFVMASGTRPVEMHLFQVDVANGAMRQLTDDRGWHSCDISPDGKYAIDSFSNLETPGQIQIIDVATGKKSHVKRIGHRFPVLGKQSLFTVPAADGTTLHGTLILPPGLDPAAAKKYPALLYVYGGPHSQMVRDTWLGGLQLWPHFMATHGYVVCALDNRGTDNRGIEFAQAVHRQLGKLEVEDQLAAIRHLQKLPYVDAKRIGVHGWSFGGFMTANLMLRAPETFACGVAGAPVIDWRQYETGYTERYMDTPKENPEGYANTSLLPLAKRLRGRLMVVHGTDDKTVMWSHSLAFVDRCVAAGVLVDYMPYPMQKHSLDRLHRAHLYRVLTRYFDDHLKPRE
ncbi:MAG: DPP IV N-terminal domain-containing protein [Planctomycetes bacterium]|nr:DPP IV N-terminal domain-containing protein [Planctomycetota bacterium]